MSFPSILRSIVIRGHGQRQIPAVQCLPGVALALVTLLMSLISLNRLIPFTGLLDLYSTTLGIIGWIAICLSLFYIGRQHARQIVLVFAGFALLGYSIGPFLEPPSDPLEHLRRTEEQCRRISRKIRPVNRGLWHYSLSGSMLCDRKSMANPESRLIKIDILHGLYWGILMVCLFCLGKAAGLPDKWAFLSGVLAFLYFGTNRFSYFSYYSLAPSFSSMFIYWTWTTIFFFKKSALARIVGIVSVFALIPIIWVNHQQETAFLLILACLWVGWNLHERIWIFLTKQKVRRNSFLLNKPVYTIGLLFLFFLLPQFKSFQNWILRLYPNRIYWNANQHLIFSWNDYHLFGKVWGSRVYDTLGLMSFMPLLLIPLFILNRNRWDKGYQPGKIMILGLVPFFIYLTPLFHFVWAVVAKPTVYYRMSYASIFWLPITTILYSLTQTIKNPKWNNSKLLAGFIFPLCVIALISLSGVRSEPVYGKLDFILLNSRPWDQKWKPIVDYVYRNHKRKLITDPVTELILNSVYQKSTVNVRTLSRTEKVDIEIIDKLVYDSRNKKGRRQRYLCVVNLVGFDASWVAVETGHWQGDLANTSLYYTYKGVTGGALIPVLKDDPPKHCKVFY